MVFDEVRPRIRYRLPNICLAVEENLGKIQPGNQSKRESNPHPSATPDWQTSALADSATPVALSLLNFTAFIRLFSERPTRNVLDFNRFLIKLNLWKNSSKRWKLNVPVKVRGTTAGLGSARLISLPWAAGYITGTVNPQLGAEFPGQGTFPDETFARYCIVIQHFARQPPGTDTCWKYPPLASKQVRALFTMLDDNLHRSVPMMEAISLLPSISGGRLLYPQPEDAPCRGDRDPQYMGYGCETWTLTLREEHRLRMFENKVLRKIFDAKRDEVTGEWRKLHNTELHALYSSPVIIRNIKSRRLRWAGHVARMGESKNAYSSWEAGGKKTFREAET
ncbi:hypothetical protein ANN_24608 [Periplaneta americana]|uniref:Uncharacterized protein n=1 Tax=Periplaneta americana TaxID=6978 RepID=A0ABQ8S3H8_PERAM|nr:hypothetical protein ANN_24608 [Periplaneta americana]